MFGNKNSCYHIQLYGDYSSRIVAFFGKVSGPKIHSLQERLIVILYTITLRSQDSERKPYPVLRYKPT